MPVDGQRPALVSWPDQAERRAELAEAGVPCLLVVRPGAPVPPVGPNEDWIARGADERDVAARLERLGRMGRAVRSGSVAPVPAMALLPAGLGPDEHRVASRLIASMERLVPVADLPVDDLADVISAIGPALRSLGCVLTPVGTAGFLLEPDGARAP